MKLNLDAREGNSSWPAGWEILTCGDVCQKIQDGTHFSPKLGGNDFLYVTSKNIGFGVLKIDSAERISKEQHDIIYKRCDVKRGDLLLTKDGANTGNAAINQIEEPFSLLSSVAFLRFAPGKNEANYFLQQILSAPGQQQIQEAMSGNAITRLTLDKIKKLRFPVPKYAEQRAIATALGDVDALLGALDKLIAKKRDLKQAAMQQLLTGQTRLPGFSGEWRKVRLGEVAKFYKGKGLPKSALAPDGTEPCVHYGELFTQYGETINETLSRTNRGSDEFRSVANDVLMPTSDVTPRGLAKASCIAIDNVVLGGDILVIRVDPNLVSGSFLSYVIRREEDQVLRLVTGSTVFHLYGRDMAKFTFRLPKIDEQRAVVEVLSDMDAELAALQARRDKTRALKQGMMQELLTGRIRLV
ncbi:restriction endonuclease subunit S [Rudaea sp.]|uniref:restriction endonuclease subunit S n=1 Tax=Rudaea sp. TaxID=2136325 RepID=UPI00321FEE9C